MSTNELSAKLNSLSPEQRQIVESLIQLFADGSVPAKQANLTDHSSFGAWAGRKDMPDSEAAARDLRKRASRRESA